MGNLPFMNIFLDYTFLSLYEFYLSIKDLEILDEFNLFQNLHLNTQKSVFATSTRHLGEVGRMFPLQPCVGEQTLLFTNAIETKRP